MTKQKKLQGATSSELEDLIGTIPNWVAGGGLVVLFGAFALLLCGALLLRFPDSVTVLVIPAPGTKPGQAQELWLAGLQEDLALVRAEQKLLVFPEAAQGQVYVSRVTRVLASDSVNGRLAVQVAPFLASQTASLPYRVEQQAKGEVVLGERSLFSLLFDKIKI